MRVIHWWCFPYTLKVAYSDLYGLNSQIVLILWNTHAKPLASELTVSCISIVYVRSIIMAMCYLVERINALWRTVYVVILSDARYHHVCWAICC